MKKIITLTGAFNNQAPTPMYVDVDAITFMSRTGSRTNVGVLGHSNGGLWVSETPEEILELAARPPVVV